MQAAVGDLGALLKNAGVSSVKLYATKPEIYQLGVPEADVINLHNYNDKIASMISKTSNGRITTAHRDDVRMPCATLCLYCPPCLPTSKALPLYYHLCLCPGRPACLPAACFPTVERPPSFAPKSVKLVLKTVVVTVRKTPTIYLATDIHSLVHRVLITCPYCRWLM
jgi:hypothetical protein